MMKVGEQGKLDGVIGSVGGFYAIDKRQAQISDADTCLLW